MAHCMRAASRFTQRARADRRHRRCVGQLPVADDARHFLRTSGERFDQDALTAAHAYWAFGTKVRVTFPTTGKSVVVRINDRFPSHKGRAIDLSRGAAKAIGLIGPGTGQVRLEVVE